MYAKTPIILELLRPQLLGSLVSELRLRVVKSANLSAFEDSFLCLEVRWEVSTRT